LPLIRFISRLFYVTAGIWILFALVTASRGIGDTGGAFAGHVILAGLMVINAGLLAFTGWGILRRRRPFYYLGIFILVLNIVLTITDDFGLSDLLILILYLILLAGLVMARIALIRSNLRADDEN